MQLGLRLSNFSQAVVLRAPVEEWLFDEEHSSVAGCAGHQMLGSLKDEVPSQMRKGHKVGNGRAVR